MAHTWPGNVRELENFIERALIQSTDSELDIDSLITNITSSRAKHSPPCEEESTPFPTLDDVCADHIRRALDRSRGKISGPGGAAELLDMHPNTLRQRMDKLGIAYKRRKQS
jgi:DNA-binding NtrC family response regulator